MKIETRTSPSMVCHDLSKHLHGYNKEVRGKRVSLPQPFCTFKIPHQRTIDGNGKLGGSDTFFNPVYELPRKAKAF